jgi:trehalose-6-phosphate synthase
MVIVLKCIRNFFAFSADDQNIVVYVDTFTNHGLFTAEHSHMQPTKQEKKSFVLYMQTNRAFQVTLDD